MSKFNATSETSERQKRNSEPVPMSREVKKRQKQESGEGQHWSNAFLDGGELDDWLTAENEIDHFVHNRQ